MATRKPLHPIDKEILRALSGANIRITPSNVARTIGIHPVTAQNRIKLLSSKGLVKCKLKGNRTYCKASNMDEIKRIIKRDFFIGNMKNETGINVNCSCGNSFIYSGTSKRYARCPKCRQRREIFRIINKRDKKNDKK